MLKTQVDPQQTKQQELFETVFLKERKATIGNRTLIDTPDGRMPLTYLDWVATGRGHQEIESRIEEVLEIVGNPHSESNLTGSVAGELLETARQRVKEHVGAARDDIALFVGNGTTGAINWLQCHLGLKNPGPEIERPIVAVTHMEHHSNWVSWQSCDVDLRMIKPGPDGLPDLKDLESIAQEAKARNVPFYASVTACSNVTGIETDYSAMAKITHDYGGKIFVDFAASAPYVKMQMKTDDPASSLDAIFFSPHKFLGGAQTPGVIVLDKDLYRKDEEPVIAGGGTVTWVDPWGGHSFKSSPEARESAGTPGFLQAWRTALCIDLKERMGVENIAERKSHLLNRALDEMSTIPGVEVLLPEHRKRQGMISFLTPDLHYGLVVKLLNDKFGIQVRGGCSCAGPYGHMLLDIGPEESKRISESIAKGDQSARPGWIRVSFHPTNTESEVDRFTHALRAVMKNGKRWAEDYTFEPSKGTWKRNQEDKVLSVEGKTGNAQVVAGKIDLSQFRI